MQNQNGKSYIGRYQIIDQLGQGGMATVYKAYDAKLERDVSIKVIRVDQFAPAVLERILKRFEREAKALAKLSYLHIIKIIDYGESEGAPYFVMEYMPGGTLKDRLGQPMPWQTAARLLIPIAQALDYAHKQHIVHRDVKPSNILLTGNGLPMLTDFGIAKILENDETTNLTGTGMGVGTPEYMSPEQWTGQAGPSADIYSLGVVFYEMVTGRKPYRADTPAAILLKQATEPPPRPSSYVRGLPINVEKVLLKALAKQPEDRYASMNDFVKAIETLLVPNSKPASLRTLLVKTGEPASSPVTPQILQPTQNKIGTSPQNPSSTSKQPDPHLAKPDQPAQNHSFMRWIGLGLSLIVLVSSGVIWLKSSGKAAQVIPNSAPAVKPTIPITQTSTATPPPATFTAVPATTIPVTSTAQPTLVLVISTDSPKVELSPSPQPTPYLQGSSNYGNKQMDVTFTIKNIPIECSSFDCEYSYTIYVTWTDGVTQQFRYGSQWKKVKDGVSFHYNFVGFSSWIGSTNFLIGLKLCTNPEKKNCFPASQFVTIAH